MKLTMPASMPLVSTISDAAEEILGALDLDAIEVFVWNGSCSDDRTGPFHGVVRIGYPKAADLPTADAEIAHMVQRLQTRGWKIDSAVPAEATVLEKDNAVVVIEPQDVTSPDRTVYLYSQTREASTAKNSQHRAPITLAHEDRRREVIAR